MNNTIGDNNNSQNIECGEIAVFCPLINDILVVNKDAVPLLKELWALKIFALSLSEHDINHQLCLEFSERDDIEEFLWIVSRSIGEIDGAPNKLRERMFGIESNHDDSGISLNWTYDVDVFDLDDGRDTKNRYNEKWPLQIVVAIGVTFPRSDYDFVLRALNKSVEARRQCMSINKHDSTKTANASGDTP